MSASFLPLFNIDFIIYLSTLVFQAMVSAYPVGLAALLALDVGVVVLLDSVITLMGKGAPHLWLPG